MRRYQVVTYSRDIGSDGKMDFDNLRPAITAASRYRNKEEYAAVYDRIENIAFLVFGDVTTPVFVDSVRVISFA